jgi:glycerol-3-phosphate dehydrogenase
MQRNLSRLHSARFDIVVVGGGITGATIAHDAALRGLSVALLERQDFGAATSAGSSGILHGGIRHLQRGDLVKARASMRERAYLHRVAPHLSEPLPILVPARRRALQSGALLRAAAAAYKILTSDEGRLVGIEQRMPPPAWLSRSETTALVTAFDRDGDVTGALLLYERRMRSAPRMTLAFIETAVTNGAVVANYCGVDRLLRRGSSVVGVRARDRLSGTEIDVRARLVINASGPWLTGLLSTIGAPTRREAAWPSKGMHIITRPLVRGCGVALATPHRSRAIFSRGGRHLFILPWRDHSQIGTTNSPYTGSPDDVWPDRSDIQTLLDDVNRAMPGANLSYADVTHAFGGLFPVSRPNASADVYQGTGEHAIVDYDVSAGIDGLVSVLGSKYTFARLVAERAVDLAQRKLGYSTSPCVTAEATLVDACAGRPATTAAQVLCAVEQEMAIHLDDVVCRRTSLGAVGHPGPEVLHACARLMAPALGWLHADLLAEVAATDSKFPIPYDAARAPDARAILDAVPATAGV